MPNSKIIELKKQSKSMPLMIEEEKSHFPEIHRLLENGRFQSKFEMLSIVGKGGFGVVYKVRYIVDREIYAIKKVKIHLGMSETIYDHKVYRELQAITMLPPKYIIRYYTSWIEELGEDERE
mmetsp:Transcript_34716/g.25861  ORF Transcript_34716/g.25861 Transcript_34716/m.25861 type:complete len:122 (+) Transcript_34716:296-661(+)